MPVVCPRCQSTNPELAVFCHFDGALLRLGTADPEAYFRLAQEFTFPSGRRCRTYDELAQACQDEWTAARGLLRQGVFAQFFGALGRMDLVRVVQEAMAQADPDIGLTNLLGSLPAQRSLGPRLDLQPRRMMLGTVRAGESRQVPLIINNQGQGMLHGTLSVVEGGEWLRIGSSGGNNGQCALKTAREQQVLVQVDTRGLAAAQTYGGRLQVITNGGVVEVPVRLDLTAQPFARAPFQGARTPRELAELMKAQPKAAVPLLESGEVSRWFATNHWHYPVAGTPAKGVAGVQQFFEALGLSKPPILQLSQTEVRSTCNYPDTVQGQVILSTAAKKWVYANVTSDVAWLRVLTPAVTGPQQAVIAYAIDSQQIGSRQPVEGTLQIRANGGQTLTLRVRAQVQGLPTPSAGRFLRPLVACALACLLLRLAFAPLIDFHARGAAVAGAVVNVTKTAVPSDHPAASFGGWLALPWTRVLVASDPSLLESLLGASASASQNPTREFRDYFTSSFVRLVTLFTWWLGALAGVLVVWRGGGRWADLPWSIIAGAVLGVVGSASAACLLLIGDVLPHALWDVTFRDNAGGGLIVVWILLALGCWTLLGLALGVVLTFLGPLGRLVLEPIETSVAGLCRCCGLRGAAAFLGEPEVDSSR
jgi:hypothetical protein